MRLTPHSVGYLFFIIMAEQNSQVVPQPICGMQLLSNKLATANIKNRFIEMLGEKKAMGFFTSLTNAVGSSSLMQKAETDSIILAAGQAAALDLPINPNLGFAAIIPYNDTKTKRCLAQFQIMRDGLVELALRTGQVMSIVNEPVYEGELVRMNRFRDEYEFDESKRTGDKIIGFMAYIKLMNGFEKTVYWTAERCKAHGLKYSKNYKKGNGLWVENFESMCLKTVLKHLIKKYCPKSIQMQMAIDTDGVKLTGELGNATADFHAEDEAPIDTQYSEVDPDEVPVAQVSESKPEAAPTPKDAEEDF